MHTIRRIAEIIVLGLVGTIGLFVLLVLPDLLRLIVALMPLWLRIWWVEALASVFLMTYVITRRFKVSEPAAGRVAKLARRELARIDWLMDRAWDGGLAKVVGLVCIGFLIAWAPHYLTWPWSGDEDTYALLALSWDRGILPYRDIRTFNVPGEIYLFWGLGKVFGWGRTVPFYALDASCVVLLGVVVVAWSRRKLDGALPGLVGYLAFLGYYLNMTYETTGERDWHTAFLVCSGLTDRASLAWPAVEDRLGPDYGDGLLVPATCGALPARAGRGGLGGRAEFGACSEREGSDRAGVVLVAGRFPGRRLRSGGRGGDRRRFDSRGSRGRIRRAL